MTRTISLKRASPATLQFVRYVFVGIILNLLGYLIYLGLTWLGVPPKIVVTIFYPLAALNGYFIHARYTFAYSGSHRSGLVRYVVAHVFGFLSNLVLLFVGVDILDYPHQLVQLVAIFAVAGQLFVTFKLFVYKSDSRMRDAF